MAYSGVIGIIFGAISNLLDSHILKSIGEANKKEYGASAYGVIFSIVLSGLLFLSSTIMAQYGYETLITSLAVLALSIGVIYIYSQKAYPCIK